MVASAFKTKNGVRVWFAGKLTFAPNPNVQRPQTTSSEIIRKLEEKAK